MKTVVDGLAVEYVDEGHGPVILFLHGWKDNLHTFDALVPYLSNAFRVIRLDLPGFGESEAPTQAWHVIDYARFVSLFLGKIQVKPVAFVGHSLGGRIVMKGISHGVFSSDRIVLIASAGVARRKTLRNALFYAAAKAGKLFTSVPPFSLARKRMRALLYRRAGSDYLDAGVLRETFLNIIREDLSTEAKSISVPTLMIWGGRDTETPLSEGMRLARLIPHAALEVVIEGSHFVHQESPERVAQLMRTFLQ